MTDNAADPAPRLGRAVVCLSTIDWDFIWQGHQEIMSRIASARSPVLFIENAGVRTPTWKDLSRILRRLRNWRRSVGGFHEERPNLVVFSPILLPFPYVWWARRINAWLINRAISAWVNAARCDVPVVWTFLPTPLSCDVIEALEPPASIYYCIDDFQASSESARRSKDSEAALFKRADLVFVTSRELQEKALRHRKDARIFPFGVDFEKFEARRQDGAGGEPADLAAIPRPRCGYVGGIHHWIDFDLIARTAAGNPKVSFVLVGPAQTDTGPIKTQPNVYLLGGKPHDRLPDYIAGFDLGIIPYKICDYTASVYPTKLNEYFAMGMPVVSTALPEIKAYNERHGGLVAIAADAEAFSAAVGEFARAAPNDGAQARIAAARANGWEARLEEMSALIRQRIASGLPRAHAWEEVARKLAWPRKLVWTATGSAVLAAVLRLTPLLWWLAQPLLVAREAKPADAIVVLAGGAGESGNAGQGHEERLAEAIDLYRHGYARRMIFCSGYYRTYREPDVMRDIAVAEGVPAEAITLAHKGGGTDKMIGEADVIIRSSGWSSVLLVSSPYHMRRCLLIWRKVDPGLTVLPIPARHSDFYGFHVRPGSSNHPATATFEQLGGILREYAAIAYDCLTGRL